MFATEYYHESARGQEKNGQLDCKTRSEQEDLETTSNRAWKGLQKSGTCVFLERHLHNPQGVPSVSLKKDKFMPKHNC